MTALIFSSASKCTVIVSRKCCSVSWKSHDNIKWELGFSDFNYSTTVSLLRKVQLKAHERNFWFVFILVLSWDKCCLSWSVCADVFLTDLIVSKVPPNVSVSFVENIKRKRLYCVFMCESHHLTPTLWQALKKHHEEVQNMVVIELFASCKSQRGIHTPCSGFRRQARKKMGLKLWKWRTAGREEQRTVR